jgi:hypothetical protein
MARRALAALLVLGVVLADAGGDHRAAFYLLVAAIPPLAIAAMDSFGDYLEGGSGFRSLAWAVALALAVASSAVRGQVPGETSVPAVAVSALFACLALVWAQAFVDVGKLALARAAR